MRGAMAPFLRTLNNQDSHLDNQTRPWLLHLSDEFHAATLGCFCRRLRLRLLPGIAGHRSNNQSKDTRSHCHNYDNQNIQAHPLCFWGFVWVSDRAWVCVVVFDLPS